MKKILFIQFLLVSCIITAQVGIGTTAPNTNAALEIDSNDSGVLLPRIALEDTSSSNPLTNHVAGMIVYNTTTVNDISAGFYYNDGTKWVKIGNKDWSLNGNAGTSPGNDFIGTTDNQDLIIKTNNLERFRVDTGGHIRATTSVSGNVPSYSWQGDVDTGMRRNGSDDMSLMAGDTGMIRLVESGLVNTVSIEPGTSVSTDFNVKGRLNPDLFYVNGDDEQVTVNTTNAVLGDKFVSTGRYAINGYSTGDDDFTIYSEADGGNAISIYGYATDNSSVGVAGVSKSTNAISPPEGSGGAFTGVNFGLTAYRNANNNQNDEGGAYIVGKMNTTTFVPSQYAYVSANIGGTWYKINGTGSVASIVDHPNGGRVNMFCPEAPEILFEDHGQGQLVNGKAIIQLDAIFKHNVTINEKHPLRVYIQLEDDCNGVFVTNKSVNGFTVKELVNGTSNAKFSYHIVANRKDDIATDGTINSKNADVRFPKAAIQKAQNSAFKK